MLRNAAKPDLETILSSLMLGSLLDPMSPFDSLIVEIAIVRDGLRGGSLAVTACFLNEAGESWAGVYLSDAVTPVPLPSGPPLLATVLGILAFFRRRR